MSRLAGIGLSIGPIKYLGVQFESGRFLRTDNDIVVRKFYAAANANCSHVKSASEISVLFLMETFCLPILSYSCEALCYTKQQLSQLNTCWNRAYRTRSSATAEKQRVSYT